MSRRAACPSDRDGLRRGAAAIVRIFLLVLLLLAGGRPVHAAVADLPVAFQESTPSAMVSQEAPAVRSELLVEQFSDPLPTPDLRRAYGHVFAAFGIAWAMILGYVLLLNRRLAGAERDLERWTTRHE